MIGVNNTVTGTAINRRPFMVLEIIVVALLIALLVIHAPLKSETFLRL